MELVILAPWAAVGWDWEKVVQGTGEQGWTVLPAMTQAYLEVVSFCCADWRRVPSSDSLSLSHGRCCSYNYINPLTPARDLYAEFGCKSLNLAVAVRGLM